MPNDPETAEGSGLEVYGLRAARRIITELRREMASDPYTRRSRDPFIRGKREALSEIEHRLNQRITNA